MKAPKIFLRTLLLMIFLIPCLVRAETTKDMYIHYLSKNMIGILDVMSEVMGADQNLKKNKQKFNANFSKLLNKRFSEKELSQIHQTFEKMGGDNIVKMTRVMIKELGQIMSNTGNLADITLNISPSYSALIDKKFAEENMEEKLKSFYFKDQAKRSSGKNLTAGANHYVKIAKKHFKKTMLDNFTEEQYRIGYEFERSHLGKKLSDTIEESVAVSMS